MKIGEVCEGNEIELGLADVEYRIRLNHSATVQED